MKLLLREDHHDGQVYNDVAFIVVGCGIGINGKKNGWHLILNLPFIKRTKVNYLDVCTWQSRTARCYPRIMIICRKPRTRKPRYRMYLFVSWTEI